MNDTFKQGVEQATGTSSSFSDGVSQITGNYADNSPSDINSAQSLGNTPTASKYNGYCQQFVDDVLQTPPQNRQATASDAWNNYAQQGLAHSGTHGIQSGDLIYFEDPNDPAGHVGLYAGNQKFISATQVDPQHPVQSQTISGWQDLTGDKVLGFVKNPENLPTIGGQK